MARTKQSMIDECLKVIEDNKLIFITEVVGFVTFCRATFYNNDLDKIDSIKTAIENNRLAIKQGLRKKWYDSESPALQIALYKLTADANEYAILNTQAVDHKGAITINYDKQDAKV